LVFNWMFSPASASELSGCNLPCKITAHASGPALPMVATALRTLLALRSALMVRPPTLMRTRQRGLPSGADRAPTAAASSTMVALMDLAVRMFVSVKVIIPPVRVINGMRVLPGKAAGVSLIRWRGLADFRRLVLLYFVRVRGPTRDHYLGRFIL
jgi:hypothetical protein